MKSIKKIVLVLLVVMSLITKISTESVQEYIQEQLLPQSTERGFQDSYLDNLHAFINEYSGATISSVEQLQEFKEGFALYAQGVLSGSADFQPTTEEEIIFFEALAQDDWQQADEILSISPTMKDDPKFAQEAVGAYYESMDRLIQTHEEEVGAEKD